MKKNIFEKNVPGLREKLSQKTIGIAGCGGLGSNAAVSLVRAGVEKLILADFDKIEESNLNRQHFFLSDVGKFKTLALENHLKSINPDIELKIFNTKVTPANLNDIFGNANILIEAFDRAEDKIMLLNIWSKSSPNKPVIIASGVAGYGKTERLKINNIGNIYFCGDEESELELGLCSARVAIVANMQANLAIELIMNGRA